MERQAIDSSSTKWVRKALEWANVLRGSLDRADVRGGAGGLAGNPSQAGREPRRDACGHKNATIERSGGTAFIIDVADEHLRPQVGGWA